MSKEEDKIQKMWCSECEQFFDTQDYFNCIECEHCKSKTVVRVSSTSFIYAYENKKREKELISFLMFLRKNTTTEKAKKIVKKFMWSPR